MEQQSMSLSAEVEAMSLDEIRAELRQVFGKPWTSDADGARRQALWQRLDKLAAEQPRTLPAGPDVGSPEPEQTIDEQPQPPDLQALIDRAGRRRAAELGEVGEVYVEDPFKRPPHQGGYPHITADEWAEYDRQMADYHVMRRIIPRK
jgi:hypothetical protein